MRKSEIKESFLIKKEYWDVIQKWKVEQKAELLDAIFTYQISGDYHTQSERVEDMMTTLIAYWNKNNERYDDICEKNRQIALQREAKKRQNSTTVYDRTRTTTKSTDIDIDKDIIEKEIDKEKESSSPKQLFGAIVELSQVEYDRLAEKFGEATIKKYIVNMDSYCAEKNKRYKDYNLALQKWMAKDNVKELPQKKTTTLKEFEIEAGVYDIDKINSFNSSP